MHPAAAIARVALDVPVATLFDYRIEDALDSDVGRRVLVPLGRKTAVGVVVELADQSELPPARLRAVVRVLRGGPAFSPDDLQLLRFASGYYHHPYGAVVMAALPALLRRVKEPTPKRADVFLRLTEAGATELPGLPARSVKRRLLEHLAAGDLSEPQARGLFSRASRAIAELTALGFVTLVPAEPGAPPAASASVAPKLTAEQAAAVARICADDRTFRAHLLMGVAGSGKTEVYLHAMAHALSQGLQALVLVPEIALTPQLESLVRARFPAITVASLHSGLNESERLEHWLAAHSGAARIVLGTRLAVFTPMPQLGIVILDEEHDGSFKQAEGFRYSARDLAVARARLRNVPVVLGSATPALETYQNAVTGRYTLLTLSQRIGAPPPNIVCLDTRGERSVDGLSARLLDALRAALARGEQSLVFINRRGYAPVLACRSCGWTSGCGRCSAQLVLHLSDRQLRCHHCGQQAGVPAACPSCGNQDLAPVGHGTQRIEVALAAALSPARVLRIDRDSTRRRNAWAEMRQRIERREVDVLVGTQILAKGHDFPYLNLVAVLNADSVLYSADFRASERLFALLTQVAGRAGRGETQGTVLIQTEFPAHPLYEALKRHDYRAFADGLLAERKAAGFPPFVHQALLRAEAPQLTAALDFLSAAERAARELAPEVTVYDPVPALLARRAGRERAQLLVQSASRPVLHRFLRAWYAGLSQQRASRARWSLDVDPLDV